MTEPVEVAPAFEAEPEERATAPAALSAADAGGPQVAPYGFWRSPITAELVAQGGLRFSEVRSEPGGAIYWIEGRPLEKGRNVVVRRDAEGRRRDVTPAEFNARTRIHEYGGGAFAVHRPAGEGRTVLVFVHFDDNRLYRQDIAPDGTVSAPVPLTPDVEAKRYYAEPVFDVRRNRVLAVSEDHRAGPAGTAAQHVVNSLVAVSLEPGAGGPAEPVTLAKGHDFYSSARVSPDGNALCFLTWDHPSMPWFGCTLYVAQIAADGGVGEPRPVAGGVEESIFQPEWGPASGALYYVSDRQTGWWNLYRSTDPLGAAAAERVTEPLEAEFGAPQWNLGLCLYDFLPAPASATQADEEIVCGFSRNGLWELGRVRPQARTLTPLAVAPFNDIQHVRAAVGRDGGAAVLFAGGGPASPASVVRLPVAEGGRYGSSPLEVLASAEPLPAEIQRYLSSPRPVTFETTGGKKAHAFYYPPHNPDFTAPADDRPPLLVKGHGGPTSAASTRMALGFQFWTSRGIGILDVNYGGSTGFGREFRFRLYRQWGITDIEDCVSAAQAQVKADAADGTRLLISGGSAGGYTALRAITFRPGVFAAAGSFYGVSDLEALARDTHKFESHYLDWLIGPYPQDQAIYQERSPIHAIDKLSVPVVFFQGSEDRIVPPNQAEMMVEALRRKGLPVGYFLFEGEGHGFRQGPNIIRSTEGELYFYSFTVLREGLRF